MPSCACTTQVRRKADPAKEALQTFVRKWKDDVRVKGHPSHTEIIGRFLTPVKAQELGEGGGGRAIACMVLVSFPWLAWVC